MAKMTLWGIEAFLKSKEESVFDQLVLPVGITKDDVVDNIFLKAGEFEVLFADPDFLKYSIGVWGRKYYRTFEKWITALNVEYNPLENYDRVEEWTDNNTENSNNLRTNNLTQSDNTTRTDNLTQIENSTAITSDHQTGSDSSTVSGSQETVNQVSAFDSSTFSNKDKQNVSNSSTSSNQNANDSNINSSSNGTISNTGTVTESGTMSNTGTISDVENSTANNRHTGRIHGNIGVTTSQQMLMSELDIAKWNLIEQITDLYISEFCVAIY